MYICVYIYPCIYVYTYMLVYIHTYIYIHIHFLFYCFAVVLLRDMSNRRTVCLNNRHWFFILFINPGVKIRYGAVITFESKMRTFIQSTTHQGPIRNGRNLNRRHLLWIHFRVRHRTASYLKRRHSLSIYIYT